MLILFITLTIFTALLLVLIIVIQNPKGGGLSSQFGGTQTHQFMGAKQANNILEKITWGLATTIFLLVVSTTLFLKHRNNKNNQIISPNIAQAKKNIIQEEKNTVEKTEEHTSKK